MINSPNQDADGEQIAEQRLWQAVILQAVFDATYEGNNRDILNEKPRADVWIKYAREDFRTACSLAGMDADALREAYVAGRIDRVVLKDSRDVKRPKVAV